MFDHPSELVRIVVQGDGRLTVNDVVIASDKELHDALKEVASWSPQPLVQLQLGPEIENYEFVGKVIYSVHHYGFTGRVQVCDENGRPYDNKPASSTAVLTRIFSNIWERCTSTVRMLMRS